MRLRALLTALAATVLYALVPIGDLISLICLLAVAFFLVQLGWELSSNRRKAATVDPFDVARRRLEARLQRT